VESIGDLELSVVNSNPAHSISKVYSIQLYVIKFVCDLPQVGGFLWVEVLHQ